MSSDHFCLTPRSCIVLLMSNITYEKKIVSTFKHFKEPCCFKKVETSSLHSFGKPPCMAFAIAYDSHRQSSFRIVFGRSTILKIKHLNCLEDMNRVLINRNKIHKCFMIYILYSLETAINSFTQTI